MMGAQFLKEPLPIIPRAWEERTKADKRTVVRELVQYRGFTYAQAGIELGASRTAIAGVVSRAKEDGEPILANSRIVNQHDREIERKAGKKQPDDRPGDNVRAQAIARKLKDPKKPRLRGFNAAPPAVRATERDSSHLFAGAWLALPGSSPKALEQHTGGCRWPIGSDLPFAFCSETTEIGKTYCPVHDRMSVRPPTQNEKKLSKAPKAVA